MVGPHQDEYFVRVVPLGIPQLAIQVYRIFQYVSPVPLVAVRHQLETRAEASRARGWNSWSRLRSSFPLGEATPQRIDHSQCRQRLRLEAAKPHHGWEATLEVPGQPQLLSIPFKLMKCASAETVHERSGPRMNRGVCIIRDREGSAGAVRHDGVDRDWIDPHLGVDRKAASREIESQLGVSMQGGLVKRDVLTLTLKETRPAGQASPCPI